MSKLQSKLANLPAQAGVYYHLDEKGDIIYVGKAANLKARVRQYFQSAAWERGDIRARNLRDKIADVQWTVTDNALQALFLESEMIKRYQPRYNFLERNVLGESWIYVLIFFKLPNPSLRLVRDLDASEQEVEILGPYLDGRALKKALKYLRRSFPYSTHKTLPRQACLDYHLGLCPGPETADFKASAARRNLKSLTACLKGRQRQLLSELKKEMKSFAKSCDYEQAAKIRDQITALEDFRQGLIFKDLDRLPALAQDQALRDLRQLFNLSALPHRIEAYDISHISGRYTSASMVVAIGGLLRPDLGRRFKSAYLANDDFAQIRLVMRRRFASRSLSQTPPDLILIDGGRGQVSSVQKVLSELQLEIPVIGLAKKREEIIFSPQYLKLNQAKLQQLKGELQESANFVKLKLDAKMPIVKFLQRLRDASHRSAWSYHNYLQTKAQTASPLLTLPGFGLKTYQKLMKRFGSLSALKRAPAAELEALLNRSQQRVLAAYFKDLKQ